MTLTIIGIERAEKPRYAMYRYDTSNQTTATYEIVECYPGDTDRTMALGVRYQDAVLIVEALNAY